MKEIEGRVRRNWLKIIREADSEKGLIKFVTDHGVSLTREQAPEALKLLKSETNASSETELSLISGSTQWN